jgi:branched-chain amino acid transport system permease protein
MVGGVAVGCAYALLAVAYSLVYRTSRAINFAQGDLAIMGAYIAFAGPGLLGDHRVPGIAAGLVGIAVVSVMIDRIAFRPLYKHDTVFVVASSIALVFVLETFMRLVWGSQTISAPELIPGSLSVGGLNVTGQQLLIAGVMVAFLIALQALFRSRIGVAMRASAENRDVAQLLGINPQRMVAVSFALAGVASAAAGILLAPLTQLRPGAGALIGLTAIIAAIVGGFGSIPGAVLGGILVGLVEVWATYVVGGAYAQTMTIAILILVLLVRPSGLLGEEGLNFRR